MVYFVGAGTGAEDLITVRGMRLLEQADVIIYAGSLVNPKLLEYAGKNCEIYNSARMTLEEVIDRMTEAEKAGKKTVRLHTGEPSIYGAVREQMDALEERGLSRGQCLLWSGSSSESGIYAPRRFPVPDHHQNGGKDSGTKERKYRELCSAPDFHGHLLEYRYAGRIEQTVDCRGIQQRYARRTLL